MVYPQKKRKEEKRNATVQREAIERAKVAGLHPHQKEARETRKESAALRAREAEAVQRVAHRKAQQEEAWQAEIAQYGEEEARRRRAEEFDVRREADDDIATSEVEVQLEEEMADHPDLHVQTDIRVDKRLMWQKAQKKTKLADFNVGEYEAMVQEHLDILGAEIVTLVAYIKAHHAKATWVPQSFEDFSLDEWNSVVEVIQDQSAMWKYEVTLKIEVTAKKTAATAATAAAAAERLTYKENAYG
ncbi:MAG: hypothetical protein Q9196_001424 [Gyalolechia fulgens]